ncbi:hypothetical protein C1T31_06950 [Hanstruepera neustonica]|uniref:Uncharacterized protein n=1 Tax=Hanstruepera neustonica TaxID=1445657 RepID=A0A2K1E191_9FLAO|nr:hypothetical protein [Hanstruepera neustonica]PNQ74052.1 hypothetical protein C1T31_06950 [Hanstruepera neustonica]
MTRTINIISGILIASLLFTNCSSDKKKNRNIPVESITEIDSILSPITENFEIQGNQESVIKGKKGTSIYIPANAFQFTDGTEPKETITIKIKECFSLTDMISENLHTVSGDKILETNGMVYLNAEADGKKLSIKQGKAIAIGFPKNGLDKEMDLFYEFKLNDSVKTWIPDYKFFETKSTTETVVEIDSLDLIGEDIGYEIEYPIEMTEDLYDYGYWISLRTATFDEIKLLNREETVVDFIENPKNIDSVNAHLFYKNNWRADFDFYINKKGEIYNLRPNKDIGITYNKQALKIARELFESLPPFDIENYERDIRNDWDYSLGIMSSRSINWKRFKQKFRNQYSDYTNQAIQKIDQNTLQYYMFSATEMGWINCDRFWDIEDSEKTDFIVKTNNPTETKIQIIFKDIKSIMTGTYENGVLVFKNIPKGKEIKVIGISYSNGKPTLAVGESFTDSKDFELTNFQEFTLDQLEIELNKLN